MAKFNVIQKKKRAQIAERKRAIHGDPSSRKLKIVPSSLRRQCLTLQSSSAPLVKPHSIFMLRFPIRITSFLVLTNGIEVKLQRNAFSFIEAPTGNEEDDDFDFDSIPWHGSDLR